MTSSTPETAPTFDKRVVLLVMSGPLAGLHQITGTVSQITPDGDYRKLVPFYDNVGMPDGRRAPVGLVSVHTRFVLYKEIYGPPTMRYDKMDPKQA